ncbi:MAG TPA: phosphoglucosamine mutase [Tepidisphaeraceae bacterium]|jgi:phosphomannomutase|nr:phosphoglucosamine mutase [Tepidisphaeraceae bacterium]
MEALMIGVSGMRGTIGGTLTPAVVGRMAAAFAFFLKETQKPANGTHFRVVFGRDSRPSGSWVRDAAAAALTASGIEVIDLDIVTTPGVAMMVKHLSADAGIVATASHNPIEWNGLKFLNRQSIAPPPADAEQVKKFYDDQKTAFVRVEHLVPQKKNGDTHALHVKSVVDRVDVLGIASKHHKVVLDSVNGAGCVATATLLSKLGCQVVHINATPDGKFPHKPEPTAENLTQLADEVKRQKAACGFAQDPDADRLAIIDENGTYIGEEYSLALCAKWILSKKSCSVTVANLSTSRMLDDIAAAAGSRVVRTPVGEANVVQAMLKEGSIIGGEGNGGVIDPRIVPGRDSLVGMAYVLSLMTQTGKTISQLVAEIPKYEIVKTKFECRREDAERAVAALKQEFAKEKIDTQDGIRIDWANSWVHARPSNTEPIMRIIAEAPDRASAEKYIGQVRTVVDRALGSNG